MMKNIMEEGRQGWCIQFVLIAVPIYLRILPIIYRLYSIYMRCIVLVHAADCVLYNDRYDDCQPHHHRAILQHRHDVVIRRDR
jgi:hypothetical protein